jgi:hypothetical protein
VVSRTLRPGEGVPGTDWVAGLDAVASGKFCAPAGNLTPIRQSLTLSLVTILTELAFSRLCIIDGRAGIDDCVNGRIVRKPLPIFASKSSSDRQDLGPDPHPFDAENDGVTQTFGLARQKV